MLQDWTVVAMKLTNVRTTYEMKQWCLEQFGPRWTVVDIKNPPTVSKTGTWDMFLDTDEIQYIWRFKNERDAFLFKLRWV